MEIIIVIVGFTGVVVQALVMEVVNMEVRRGGDGVKPIIRMCRLMLMIMGRCALPLQMVW